MSEEDFYPCFQEFNETELACTELGLSVLMQLSYAKQAEDVFKGDHISKEIQSFPMLFDTSNAPERLTFTY